MISSLQKSSILIKLKNTFFNNKTILFRITNELQLSIIQIGG